MVNRWGQYHLKTLFLDTLPAALFRKGPKQAKPNIGPLLPMEFLTGKLLYHGSAIFWLSEVSKVSFPIFYDAVSPKTVFSIDVDTI